LKTNENTYDAIIIGSGMGALTTGSILAQLKNKRVLILERNFKAGGFTHIFKRKGKYGSYKWDVGLHYVGNMQKGEMPRAIFDFITQGKVKWNSMPENYDTFIYPDLTFKVRAGKEKFKSDLIKEFPNEKASIERYFEDIKKVSNWSGKYFVKQSLPQYADTLGDMLLQNGIDYSQITLKEYLENNFVDEKLKAVISSQWGDYGLPPSKASFAIHVLVAAHYFEGAFYPVGGSKTIADSILPLIESKGGKLILDNTVEQILIDDWKAIGVKVSEKSTSGEKIVNEYFADTIISNAGARITYRELMPHKYAEKFPSAKEEVMDYATGHVNLYIGLKESASKLGIKGENFWLFDSYDHEKIYNSQKDIAEGKVHAAFVSFPGLKDPEESGQSVEVIAFAPYEAFRKWENQPWKKRDEEYLALKEKITGELLDFVEKYIKGFKELVNYAELSTPLSTRHFTGNYKGNIYGVAATPERYKNKLVSSRTPIKNLYLTGADTASGHGITGAMMGGVLTAGIIMGDIGIMKIFSTAMKYSNKLTDSY
jgi:all-trans-retinol 13,14-reductase